MAFSPGSSHIANLICERLEAVQVGLKRQFCAERSVAARSFVVDDLLPEDLARTVSAAFPKVNQMRRLDSFRERKYTTKSLEKFDQILTEVTFAFQHSNVLHFLAEITGQASISSDPMLYAGGLSTMGQGDFLNPHIDNSHDQDGKKYRVLNSLYYVSPDWSAADGGGLELWDSNVRHRTIIPPLFNRLVVMETNARSFHSVSEITAQKERLCVSNYFFSIASPNGFETEHVTYFRGRPERKLSRVILRADSELRTAARKVKRSGFSRSDTYGGSGM